MVVNGNNERICEDCKKEKVTGIYISIFGISYLCLSCGKKHPTIAFKPYRKGE